MTPVFASTDTADFSRRVREALDSIVARGGEFSVDDVWAQLTLRGVENRAPSPATVGSIFNSYRAGGLIENTGRSHISRRGPAKGRRVSVWYVRGGAM